MGLHHASRQVPAWASRALRPRATAKPAAGGPVARAGRAGGRFVYVKPTQHRAAGRADTGAARMPPPPRYSRAAAAPGSGGGILSHAETSSRYFSGKRR